MRVPTLVSSQGPPDAARSVDTANGPGSPAHADADQREVEQPRDGVPGGSAADDNPFHLNLMRWRMVF